MPETLLERARFMIDNPSAWETFDQRASDMIRELTALASLQPSVSEMRGWQPIETAPKDGTKFDVWTADGERWTDVWWESAKSDWMHWWQDSWGGMGAQRLGVPMTHWMSVNPPALSPEGEP